MILQAQNGMASSQPRCQHTRTTRAVCVDPHGHVRSYAACEAAVAAEGEHTRVGGGGAPVVMLATGVTAAARVLAVLAHATMARAHVPPLLAVGLEACSKFRAAEERRAAAAGGGRTAGGEQHAWTPTRKGRVAAKSIATRHPNCAQPPGRAATCCTPCGSQGHPRGPALPLCPLPPAADATVDGWLPRLPSTTPLLPVPPMSCSSAAAAAALTGRHRDHSSRKDAWSVEKHSNARSTSEPGSCLGASSWHPQYLAI